MKDQKLTVDEVVIDGQTYVPKGSEQPNVSGDVKIVVLQRGWVAVGRLTWEHEWIVDEEGAQAPLARTGTLTNASTIRRWGTTRGLGQLALEGPTASTVLDRAGTIWFHEQTAVLIMSCVEDKWASRL